MKIKKDNYTKLVKLLFIPSFDLLLYCLSVKDSHSKFLAPDLRRRGPEGKARMFPASSCVVIVLSRPSVLGDMEGTVERPCKYIFSAALTLV